MFKHHLFELLRTFTKADIDNFNTFLLSPYFNKSTKIVALYKEIMRYYPSFNSLKLTKENLCKKISRRGNYNDSTIRDALSTLLRLVQQFIVQKISEENKFDSLNNLLKELSKRKQDHLFRKNSEKFEEEITKEGGVDSSRLLIKFLFETNKFNYSVINNEMVNKKNIFKQFEKLNKSGVYLTYFFLTELICEYLNLLTYSRKYNLNYKENNIYRCLHELDISKIADIFDDYNEYNFLINIYIKLFEAYSNIDKERYYLKYKEMILEFSDKLSRDERSFHYSRLINYCIIKKNSGKNKRKFDLELFGIYELILEKEYFCDSKVGYLPTDLYRDIMLQALSLKKFK